VSAEIENETGRKRLGTLRDELLSLHKTLIDSERIGYEQTFGTIASPSEFLRLLINDPWFVWLKPLSGLITRLDEILDDDDEPVTAKQTADLSNEVSALLTPSEEGEGFGRQYFEALQREPAVIMAHAAVVRWQRASH
jgi:hypothetical protein